MIFPTRCCNYINREKRAIVDPVVHYTHSSPVPNKNSSTPPVTRCQWLLILRTMLCITHSPPGQSYLIRGQVIYSLSLWSSTSNRASWLAGSEGSSKRSEIAVRRGPSLRTRKTSSLLQVQETTRSYCLCLCSSSASLYSHRWC